MNGISPESPLAPEVFKFSDIDQFRSSVRNVNVDFVPLVQKICAEQIILSLPGCAVNFTRSFPRIVDVELAPNCTAVGFTMDDGIPIRFNGVELDHSVIMIGSNGATYNAIERVERRYASIIFMPQVDDRGWPEAGPNFKVFETSPASQRWLRILVREILAGSANFSGAAEASQASSAIRASLLAAIDGAFADVVATSWAFRANSVRQFKVFQDVRAALSANIANPIYSDDLAKQLGVSVRTIHDAVLRYRGMSLHRYLRLRRLWLVRRQLRAGTHSVKASALAFGFWHLGDFSQGYRAQFGESPSETLARSRTG